MRLKFRKIFKDQSGFSLVEILIGVSILGLIAVGTMTMMANTTLSLKKASNKNLELTLQTEINQVISDSEFCKKAVIGNASPLTSAPYKMKMKIPSVPSVLQTGTVVDQSIVVSDFYVDGFSAPVVGPTATQKKVNGVLWLGTRDQNTEGSIQRAPRKLGLITLVYNDSTKSIVDCYGQGPGAQAICVGLGMEWNGTECQEPAGVACTRLGLSWNGTKCQEPANLACARLGLSWNGSSCENTPMRACAQIGGTWNGSSCVLAETSTRSSIVNKGCGSGQYLQGFNGAGGPICGTLVASAPAPSTPPPYYPPPATPRPSTPAPPRPPPYYPPTATPRPPTPTPPVRSKSVQIRVSGNAYFQGSIRTAAASFDGNAISVFIPAGTVLFSGCPYSLIYGFNGGSSSFQIPTFVFNESGSVYSGAAFSLKTGSGYSQFQFDKFDYVNVYYSNANCGGG